MRPLPLLLCLCLSAPAFALNLQDSPVRGSLLTQAPEVKTELGFTDTVKIVGAGAAAAVVSVPASLLLGMALGTTTNSLYAAAIPAVFSWVLLPPIAVTLAEWIVGRNILPGSTRLIPGMFVGMGVNLVIVVASILLGVNARDVLHVVAVTGVSAAAIPLAVGAFIKKPKPEPTYEASWREQVQQKRPELARTSTLVEVPL